MCVSVCVVPSKVSYIQCTWRRKGRRDLSRKGNELVPYRMIKGGEGWEGMVEAEY